MAEIFISYSRQNVEFVDKLVGEIEKRGQSIWVDRDDIRGGTAWRSAISEAIRACEIFIIVLSDKSILSENVTKELALADKHKKAIVPVCFQQCDIPPNMEYQLAGLQIIDFVEQSFSAGLEELLFALHVHSKSEIQNQEEQSKIAGLSQLTPNREQRLKLMRIIGIVGLVIGIVLMVIYITIGNRAESDLSGLYHIRGIDFDCKEYGGEATITKSGKGYRIEGRTRGSDAISRSTGGGTGELKGNVFTITWDNEAGETIYSLKSDGSLVVLWLYGATDCEPGETWTPQ